MYIPSYNKITNEQEAVNFMQRYSFATLVSSKDDYPSATHLPFLVKQNGEELILSSHFAKANPQASEIFDRPALVIFTEPHAYISPKNYEKEQSVPTWNYIAVHAYGQARILEQDEEKLTILSEMIDFYDAAYQQQWQSLPMDFKQKMLKGIVAFEITVNDLQGKSKLSQNRTAQEKDNIISNLQNSPHSTETELAEYMKALKTD